LGETERHRAGVTSSCTLIRQRFVKGQQIGSEVDAEERDTQYALHTKHTGSMEMSLDIRLETEWIMEKKIQKYKTRFIQHVDQEQRNRLSKVQNKCTTSG